MQATSKKIILLGADNPTTWIVYNHLIKTYGLFDAFIEDAPSRWSLVRKRIPKLGLLRVLGQIGFILAIRPLLLRRSRQRIQEICNALGLETTEPITPSITRIGSVNSAELRAHLKAINPDIIIVNGTRIIGKKTLAATTATIINTHHGITPAYRGAHGAYWALYEGNTTECGVTVHLVDEGVDTGNIIAQTTIAPTPKDNFATYPFLQTAAALPLLTKVIDDLAGGKLQTSPATGPSAVWYVPGFFQYLKGARRGVH